MIRKRKQNIKQSATETLIVAFFVLLALFFKLAYVGNEITDDSNKLQRFLLSGTVEYKSPLEMEVQALTEENARERQEIEKMLLALDELRHAENTKQEDIERLETYISRLKSGQVSTNVDHIISSKIDEAIEKASKTYNIDSALIRAVIKQESNFNVTVVSHAGAQGLMQIMPDTAKWLKVGNVWDIEQNIMGGTQYLRDQLNTFGDMKLALAAYNAGPNAVKKYKGIPPFRETQDYVVKVIRFYNAYK
jgi:soluble lytic murein transglycosylase-like protein